MKKDKQEVFSPTYKLQHKETLDGFTYFEQGCHSANHLWRVYNKIKSKRGGATNEQQDILRSMLVMAGATLDATIKNCIAEILDRLLEGGHKCLKQVAELVNKKTFARLADEEKPSTTTVLVEAILDKHPRRKLLDIALQDIAGNSLQSVDMIFRVYGILQLDKSKLQLVKDNLARALKSRNQIIHELDCPDKKDIKQGVKIRRPRKMEDILLQAKTMLEITHDFLEQADKEISSVSHQK